MKDVDFSIITCPECNSTNPLSEWVKTTQGLFDFVIPLPTTKEHFRYKCPECLDYIPTTTLLFPNK